MTKTQMTLTPNAPSINPELATIVREHLQIPA